MFFCLKTLNSELFRIFRRTVSKTNYQHHGAEENVFNSIGNLEKVSLALSLQAKNSRQARLTDYFTPK